MTRSLLVTLFSMVLALASDVAYARTHPWNDIGGEYLPKLVRESTLVCKGEVTKVFPLRFAPNPGYLNTPAAVHIERCFKGQAPSAEIAVLYDGILPSAGWAGGILPLILERGDFALFFLEPRGEQFAPVNINYGVQSVSRLAAATDKSIVDPLQLIERELIVGLKDSNRELALANIRLLGYMEHLQSTAELKSLANSKDLLVSAYALEALMRLGDYSSFNRVAKFFAGQPQSLEFRMDTAARTWRMQGRLAAQIGRVRDPRFLPQLEEWMFSPKPFLKDNAINAVRRIASPHSESALLRLLDDPDPGFRFDAAMGLIEIIGGGPGIPVFGWEDFQSEPIKTSARVRQWWQTSGRYRLPFTHPANTAQSAAPAS
jgi:hypothetical protein